MLKGGENRCIPAAGREVEPKHRGWNAHARSRCWGWKEISFRLVCFPRERRRGHRREFGVEKWKACPCSLGLERVAG